MPNCLQPQFLLIQRVQLPLKVVDVALEHVIPVTVSHLLLLQEVSFGLQSLILLLQALYLIDEGSKLVVEGLNLLLLLVAHGLDVGVHLQLQGADDPNLWELQLWPGLPGELGLWRELRLLQPHQLLQDGGCEED